MRLNKKIVLGITLLDTWQLPGLTVPIRIVERSRNACASYPLFCR